MTPWTELLTNAVTATSKAEVARRLGVSRATVSLVANGKYPASTEPFATRVLSVYGVVECPHLGEEIAFSKCREYHTREAPTSSPYAMRHWRACQSCPHRRKP
jgi:transcriptional regulator with XRE-family HTH domain